MAPYGTTQECQGPRPTVPYKAMQNYKGPYKANQGYTRSYRTLWDTTGQNGIIWEHIYIYRFIVHTQINGVDLQYKKDSRH